MKQLTYWMEMRRKVRESLQHRRINWTEYMVIKGLCDRKIKEALSA